ncbi:MAG: aminotransferase class V-fold PLP-dependent enzyme [Gemmatimonadota bacterium]|nr:aminotransferase class V-fold PLP-dependent enzyme [Gemmatimonadota bacterium]
MAPTDSLNTRSAPCDLPSEQFRAIGHSLVDSIADFLHGLPGAPTATSFLPDALRTALGRRELPEEGRDIAPVIKEFSEKFFRLSTHNGSPRFFGYITSSAAPIGALADMLAASVNPNCGAWALSPIATEIENETIRWLSEFMGLPGTWDGVIVSGGNMANMVGFTAARTSKAGWNIRADGLRAKDARQLVLYTSKETHTWINKAADIGGLGTAAVRWIPTDHELRMRVDLLEESIAADLAAGLAPFMVCGTAGTVGTGAIDPLPAIAQVCKKYDLWFHVDGAYGAPAVALADAADDLKGLRLADSIAIDPHKWLYSPLEAGCILTRHGSALRDAFAFKPHYYQFDDNEGQEVKNYFEYGPQNSRGFRALKIWLGFQQIGANGYRRMIADEIALAHQLHEMIGGHDSLERGTVSLSITTFRFVPHDLRGAPDDGSVTNYLNELNERIATAVRLSGEAFLSNAFLDGRFMLRACIVNFRTTLKDVALLPGLVTRLGRELDAKLRPSRLGADLGREVGVTK